MSTTFKVSFAKAQSILKKFRYKPRNDWTEEDRILFKLSNFAVLSRKRLNSILIALNKLSKLSDKSHYKYSELDIKLIKELILESLGVCFEKFKQKISVIKESDLEKIENHLAKIKDENLRLENENKRLNFIIESFIREKDMVEIEKVNEILKKKISSKNRQFKGKSRKRITTDKLDFNEDNVRDFISKWNQGYTTFEITEGLKKLRVDIGEIKKRRFKL